ncbi:PTS lactose/cellobiose transporter subunit IIA [Xenorhabdus innexi]|uniref:PTS lactose/cellobiose transporter subunit IIA n=1 Tax=Xenorhabdus innexi TaxID=290109 RepID=A0A1N6N1E7_9GAMM|nr:PTS lactose/cellobiose transporter subunit IIA [Xenorhabdus innexi]PHM37007.1 PTS lactose/cellobiose transporter subunit IIA [Xenorhabdus innexi]SIP74921.1 PTS system cellobiose-specific IIA component [Xenorhabdus innexi]
MISEENILIPIAMEIILDAGNAREKSEKAMKYARDGDFENAHLYMDKARRMMLSAHCTQTDVIQKETQGDHLNLSLLFIHAQDTLMTIRSELVMKEEMIALYKLIHDIRNNKK